MTPENIRTGSCRRPISLPAALSLLRKNAVTVSHERIPLPDADGRVLAEDIRAYDDFPGFNRSMMDGYACRRRDARRPLELIGTVVAGDSSDIKVGRNQCVKIMTGARVPSGADCVIPVENTVLGGGGAVICRSVPAGTFIARRGEDVKKGAVLLRTGKILKPQDVGVLAANGCSRIKVARRIRIGIIATGNELMEPSGKKVSGVSRIFNSNAYQLCAQCRRIGADARYYGIAGDDTKALSRAIGRAASEADVILVSGGVSMGDYDLVPASLELCGFRTVFHRVKIQPGKPVLFARNGGCFCFGMPGNPVSTFVVFELMVKNFVFMMQGASCVWRRIPVKLKDELKRRDSSRFAFMPAICDQEGSASLPVYNGSGHLLALSEADSMLEFPEGCSILQKGSKAYVRPI